MCFSLWSGVQGVSAEADPDGQGPGHTGGQTTPQQWLLQALQEELQMAQVRITCFIIIIETKQVVSL